MLFRKAEKRDTEQIWQIILQAKEQMRLRGSMQWQTGYPAVENIADDVEKGYGYVMCEADNVIAYAAVVFDGEPAYETIEGKWLTNLPYVVVHRLAVAVAMKQRGIGALFMQETEALARGRNVQSFRVDTNFDNLYMQKILAKTGFTYCGEIMYDGNARMAYEKVLAR